MIPQPITARVRGMGWHDLVQARQGATPDVARLLTRAWYLPRPWWWLAHVLPSVYHRGFPPGPKIDLARACAATPAAAPGRPPISILAEQGRGLGKSNIARGLALHRLIEGLETGLVFAGATIPEATKHTKAVLALGIPPWRAPKQGKRRRRDEVIRRWLASPLGQIYPSLRYSGSVTELILHLDGRRLPIWTIAPGSSTRGKELSGIRPSLAVCDDLVTLESAGSERQTAQILEWVEDDVRGLGDTRCPAAVWWLGNAIAAGDALDIAAGSGRWQMVRGAVWTPRAPPESPEKSALLAELLALPPTAGIPTELYATWAPRLPTLLDGATPTDPDEDPLILLRQEAAMGPRAFARAYMCVRLPPGAALWPMACATLVDLDRAALIEPEGRVPLSQCQGAVWLDPRGSEAGDHGDFAAAAAVIRAPSGRRYVIALHEERCRKAGQRAIYWRCVDELLALGCSRISGGYETNGGAQLALGEGWDDDACDRRTRGLPAPIPRGYSSGSGKYSTERLDRVTDHIADGRLRFARALYASPSWRRLASIPHDHDDGADAIERADHLLGADPYAAWLAATA